MASTNIQKLYRLNKPFFDLFFKYADYVCMYRTRNITYVYRIVELNEISYPHF